MEGMFCLPVISNFTATDRIYKMIKVSELVSESEFFGFDLKVQQQISL